MVLLERFDTYTGNKRKKKRWKENYFHNPKYNAHQKRGKYLQYRNLKERS